MSHYICLHSLYLSMMASTWRYNLVCLVGFSLVGHFYNRLTQFIVYCSYVVCTNLLRRLVDLSTHWTVTAMSLHVTTFVGVCH